MLPRVIYTYWDTPHLPPVVRHCMQSWKEQNPDWRVVVVDKKHVHQSLSPPEWFDSLGPQHQADWVRYKVLAQNGGVWLDASVYLLKPVTAWASQPDALNIFAISGRQSRNHDILRARAIGPQCKGFVQFENWAFACPKGHDFVTAWLQHFERGVSMGHTAYVSWLKQKQLYPACYTTDTHRLPYFISFLAAAVVHQNRLYSQPLHVLRHSITFHEAMMALRELPSGQPFLKMTSGHRELYSLASPRGLYAPGSLAQIAYDMPKDPWPARGRLFLELLVLGLVLRLVLGLVLRHVLPHVLPHVKTASRALAA